MAKKSMTHEVVAALLAHAAGNVGYVLKPLPTLEVPVEETNKAIQFMRENGLVHGPAREPNLTREGIEKALAQAA